MNMGYLQKSAFFLCTAALVAAVSSAGAADSTDTLFNDAVIRHYEVRFYYPGWKDSLEYYKTIDETYIPGKFIYRAAAGDSIVLDSIGVRYKGNSSYVFAGTSPKKPFKFNFNKYRKQRFFGVEKLNFSIGDHDPSLMREKITYDVIKKYLPSPRASYATISTEGQNLGIYTQVEQVDEKFLSRFFKKTDNNLYKSSDFGTTFLYKGQNPSAYDSEFTLKTNTSDNNWSNLITLIDKLNNTPDSIFVSVMKSCFDLDGVIRYLAANMVFSNFDSYTGSGRNFYLYDDPASKQFKLIPWDLNLSFGDYSNGWNVLTMDIVNISNLAMRPLNKRILAADSLRQSYLQYIKDMIRGPACTDSIMAMTARLKSIIDSTVQSDSFAYYSYDNFVKNISEDVTLQQGSQRTIIPGLKSFSTKRNANLLEQLAGYLPVRNEQARRMDGRSPLQCGTAGSRTIEIRYTVSKGPSPVSLYIYSGSGKLIARLDQGIKRQGAYVVRWNGTSAVEGCYVIRYVSSNQKAVVPAAIVY